MGPLPEPTPAGEDGLMSEAMICGLSAMGAFTVLGVVVGLAVTYQRRRRRGG